MTSFQCNEDCNHGSSPQKKTATFVAVLRKDCDHNSSSHKNIATLLQSSYKIATIVQTPKIVVEIQPRCASWENLSQLAAEVQIPLSTSTASWERLSQLAQRGWISTTFWVLVPWSQFYMRTVIKSQCFYENCCHDRNNFLVAVFFWGLLLWSQS